MTIDLAVHQGTQAKPASRANVNLIRKIAGNSILLSSSGVLAKLLGLAMTVALTRYLGPDRYGDLTLAYAFMTMYLILSSFGIERATTLEIGQQPQKRTQFMWSAIYLKFLTSGVSFLLAILVIPLLGYPPLATELLFWTTPVALITPIGVPRILLLLDERIKTVALLDALYPTVSLIGVLLVVLLGSENVSHVMWSHIAAIAISDLLYYFVGTQPQDRKAWRQTGWNAVRRIFSTAWPLVSISILGMLQLQFTRLLFGYLYPSSIGALYSLALNLAIALRFLPNTYFTSVYPLLSQFSATNSKLFDETCRLTIQLVILCGIPIGLVGTLAPQTIISIVSGEDYLGAAGLFSIFVWGQVVEFSTVAMYFILLARREKKALQWFAVFSTLLYFLVLGILLPTFSLEAAGWAFLVSQFGVLTLYGLHPTTRTYVFSWIRRAIKPVAAALLAVLPAVTFCSTEVMATFVALGIFGLLVLVFGELPRGDTSSR